MRRFDQTSSAFRSLTVVHSRQVISQSVEAFERRRFGARTTRMGISNSTPKKADSDSELDAYRQQHLKDSNEYRKRHGAEPLSLDAELNKFAQNWAENLAKRNVMEHRPNNKYGENIAAGYPLSNVDAVKMWYDEVSEYNFEAGNFAAGTGHFTQLVWHGSKKVGVGIAKSSSGMYFIVANYDPPGNVMGRFTKNVIAKK